MAHVPVRTCVGCRGRAPKQGLVRIVAGPAGAAVDLAGSAPGRGAYVHRDPSCVQAALRKGGLARALRTVVDDERAATLRADIERELGASSSGRRSGEERER